MLFQVPFKFKDFKGMEQIIPTNSLQMRSRIMALIPYKMYFKAKIAPCNKEEHFIIIKRLTLCNYKYVRA